MENTSKALQIEKQMGPVFQSIAASVNVMLSSLSAVQTAANMAINTVSFQGVQEPQLPAVPAWDGASSPVFMDSGADRFASELQLANQMAQQLYQSQLRISAQARTMTVTPSGMLNDMAAAENRIQMLASRVQDLSSIPVNLRTEEINHELESIRGNLGQARDAQEALTEAISRMDISSANTAYQQLNSVVDSAERSIRDNIIAQQSFNETAQQGGGAFGGLTSKLSNLANSLGIGEAVKNVASQIYQSATQLEATQVKYNTAFAGMTASSDQFIADFQKLTPATTAEARLMAAGIQDLLLPMGMQRAEATAMTGDMMHLIGALTNFNSATMSAEAVSGAFQSAISGDYGSLNTLGIQIDDTMVKQQAVSMGLAASTDAVSNAARAQAVLTLASQQSGDALADYNEESLNTTTRMQNLKSSFTDAFAQAGQTVLPGINELLAQVQAHMPQIAAGINIFAAAFGGVIDVAGIAFEMLMNLGAGLVENWNWIAPIIAGVVTGILAYNVAMIIGTGIKAAAALAETLHKAAVILFGNETFKATMKQYGLNAALLACPITWIVIAIIAVIAAIAVWVYHVGGIKIAWLTCVDAVLTQADLLKIGFMTAWNHIQYGIDNMQYGFAVFKTGVLNTLGNLKVLGLTILEAFINETIDGVNTLLGFVSGITGKPIELFGHVDFATDAALEEKAKQSQRADNLAAQRKAIIDARAAGEAQEWEAKRQADRAHMERLAGLEIEKNKKSEKDSEQGNAGYEVAAQEAEKQMVVNTGNTAGNTAAIANSMDILDEELKYMRDAAEQEIINRFTLAELKVDVSNNNTLKTQTDFADVNRMLADVTGEILNAGAEGGYI